MGYTIVSGNYNPLKIQNGRYFFIYNLYENCNYIIAAESDGEHCSEN